MAFKVVVVAAVKAWSMASTEDMLLFLWVEEHILVVIIITILVVTVILMDYLLAKNSIAAERMIIKSFLEFFAAWRVAEQRTMEKML